MLLIKTLKGRDALQDRSSALTQKQRQILILVNGKRSSRDLLAVLGPETTQDIVQLLELRYLVAADTNTSSDFADSAPGEIWDVSEFNDEQDLPSQFERYTV